MAGTFWKFSPDLCREETTKQLARELEISACYAGAHIALLYGWAVKSADDIGSLNDFTQQAIEKACMWEGERGQLFSALCNTGVLVGDAEERSECDPLRIAGWDVVASEIILERNRARERKQKQRSRSNSVTRDVTCDRPRDVTGLKNKEPRTQNPEERAQNGELRTEMGDNSVVMLPRFFEKIDSNWRHSSKARAATAQLIVDQIVADGLKCASYNNLQDTIFEYLGRGVTPEAIWNAACSGKGFGPELYNLFKKGGS